LPSWNAEQTLLERFDVTLGLTLVKKNDQLGPITIRMVQDYQLFISFESQFNQLFQHLFKTHQHLCCREDANQVSMLAFADVRQTWAPEAQTLVWTETLINGKFPRQTLPCWWREAICAKQLCKIYTNICWNVSIFDDQSGLNFKRFIHFPYNVNFILQIQLLQISRILNDCMVTFRFWLKKVPFCSKCRFNSIAMVGPSYLNTIFLKVKPRFSSHKPQVGVNVTYY